MMSIDHFSLPVLFKLSKSRGSIRPRMQGPRTTGSRPPRRECSRKRSICISCAIICLKCMSYISEGKKVGELNFLFRGEREGGLSVL